MSVPFNGIVVDVGCFHDPPEESVYRLIEHFEPELLIGFDPREPNEGVEPYELTVIIRRAVAAWHHANGVRWHDDGMSSGVNAKGNRNVPSMDLLALLDWLPVGTILKLDAEGAEYVLLPMIHAARLDERLSLCLVEWHPAIHSNGWQREKVSLACPTEKWVS